MASHELKTWPIYFEAVAKGWKTFEVRKSDRDFKLGDILILKEYFPTTKKYSGLTLNMKIEYILDGGNFGIEPGYVVMGISKY